MSEVTGDLLVYVRLGIRPNQADLALILTAFAKTTADLGITCSSAEADSAGKTARIRAGGVTGFTDVNSRVETSLSPRILSVEIRQHPGGFEGARAEAERMAQRLAVATGLQLGPPGRMKPTRKAACWAAWPASGLALPPLTITADFTPARTDK